MDTKEHGYCSDGEAFGFGFDGPKPSPARPEAAALAEALTHLLRSEAALRKARDAAPDYTGQWSSSDYAANAQETYNRAADKLHDLLRGGS